ncbi:hypothetical protein BDE02_01G160100 [Populus trichocarpa]|nr:hypothetical protein BDE02_01G160100 [Populus trichocarpa]
MKCTLFNFFLPWDLLLRIHEAVRVVYLLKTNRVLPFITGQNESGFFQSELSQ